MEDPADVLNHFGSCFTTFSIETGLATEGASAPCHHTPHILPESEINRGLKQKFTKINKHAPKIQDMGQKISLCVFLFLIFIKDS